MVSTRLHDERIADGTCSRTFASLAFGNAAAVAEGTGVAVGTGVADGEGAEEGSGGGPASGIHDHVRRISASVSFRTAVASATHSSTYTAPACSTARISAKFAPFRYRSWSPRPSSPPMHAATLASL